MTKLLPEDEFSEEQAVRYPTYDMVTEYEFSCFPPGHPERRHFTVYVRYRGTVKGRHTYAVMRWDREAYGTDGEFDWEPSTSNREDGWLETHRFDLTTALRLAQEIAPRLKINGHTVADVMQRGVEFEEGGWQ
jgi:hypothetical protein